MMRYSNKQAARDYIRDLIVDIRCARRDGHADYAEAAEYILISVWRTRHGIDREPLIARLVRGETVSIEGS